MVEAAIIRVWSLGSSPAFVAFGLASPFGELKAVDVS